MVDVYLQAKRDAAAAKRFFKRLLQSHGGEPRNIVTDKLRSYSVAHRELMPDVIHLLESGGQIKNSNRIVGKNDRQNLKPSWFQYDQQHQYTAE